VHFSPAGHGAVAHGIQHSSRLESGVRPVTVRHFWGATQVRAPQGSPEDAGGVVGASLTVAVGAAVGVSVGAAETDSLAAGEGVVPFGVPEPAQAATATTAISGRKSARFIAA
jgi:hypothetical protein